MQFLMPMETLEYARLKKRVSRHLFVRPEADVPAWRSADMEQSRERPGRHAPPTAPRGVPPIAGWLGVSGTAATDARMLVREHERVFVEGGAAEEGLSAFERHAAAFRAAIINGHAALVEHYAARLQELGASARVVAAIQRSEGNPDLSPRMVAILRHVRLLCDGPRAIRCSHLRLLKEQGLDVAAIVALTRLVTFVNYQAGLLADLDLLERV